MNADEVVRALRCFSKCDTKRCHQCDAYEKHCEDHAWKKDYYEIAADLIESQQVEIKRLYDAAKINHKIHVTLTEDFYQLQAHLHNAEVHADCMEARSIAFAEELKESQRRERAAVEWIQAFTESIDQPCLACKYNTDSPVCSQICGGCGRMGSGSCKWQWRGDVAGEGEKE